jgi:hypothetical protein
MSKFPLIGKNVLVIYGKQENQFKELYVAGGKMVSFDSMINDKKEAFTQVTLQLLGVKYKIDNVLLITLYSKELKKQEKEQTPQTNSQTTKTPQSVNLSADDVQLYLKSDKASDFISVYQLNKKLEPVQFTVPEKYFKLLSLKIIVTQATFQMMYLDKIKATHAKKETKVVENIFALFNPRDLYEQSAGKLWHSKKRSKRRTKRRTKKGTKRLT